jgi:hypothetical protein
MVEVNDRVLSEVTPKQREHLNELNEIGYNLQSFIE